MHILYKITYLPHLNTSNPKFYIGSKYNYKRKYLGSPSSNQIFPYTNSVSLKDWWKQENKKNPSNFVFEILEILPDNITPQELVLKEKDLQLSFNVSNSPEYFNQSIATKGFCSTRNRSVDSKKKTSDKTKAHWDSPKGQLKKQRLSERNKQNKSNEQKKYFNDPIHGKARRKLAGAGNAVRNNSKIEYNGKIYSGWQEFSKETGISKYRYRHYQSNGFIPNSRQRMPATLSSVKISSIAIGV